MRLTAPWCPPPLSPTLPVVGGVGGKYTHTHAHTIQDKFVDKGMQTFKDQTDARECTFFLLPLSFTHMLTVHGVNLRTCSNKLWVKNSSTYCSGRWCDSDSASSQTRENHRLRFLWLIENLSVAPDWFVLNCQTNPLLCICCICHSLGSISF